MVVPLCFCKPHINIIPGRCSHQRACGGEYLHVIMIGLAIFALVISLGGMKVIGYTDVIQVAVLIIGGLVTTYIALTVVGEKFGVGSSAIAGFKALLHNAPEHLR